MRYADNLVIVSQLPEFLTDDLTAAATDACIDLVKRGAQLVNLGGCGDCHTPMHFDPAPYALLDTIVALEAILLASFILMRQTSQNSKALAAINAMVGPINGIRLLTIGFAS